MNILLSHGYFLEEDVKEQKIMRPYPPLGLLYISAYLEEHGIPNDVFDTTFSGKNEFRHYLKATKPGIVGLYVNLMTKLTILDIISFIRKNLPETKIILGGPDVRYNAENYLRSGADFIVMGEGEQTMLELVRGLLDPSEQTDMIEGIACLRDGTFFRSPEREQLKDLNELPLPARSKIDFQKYLDTWKKHHGKSALSVSTMRGCPYTCKWCSRGVYGLSYRRRSAHLVVEELRMLQDTYRADTFWFVDDVFTISHKWMENFREELQKRNLHISYECITRADRLNEHVIGILKETGCFRVWIGAESGSQKVIDLMDRRVQVGQVRDMIRLTRRYGIEAGTFIMLGYPGETEEDIEETIRHLKESNPDQFTITIAYPIKGTEFYAEVQTSHQPEMDWHKSTDRQTDFRRTYSRRYYDFAVRRVVNEMNSFTHKRNNLDIQAAKFKLKSIAAKSAMKWHRLTQFLTR